MTLVIGALLIWGRTDNESTRLQLTYRIAHSADFNSSFRCNGLDEKAQSVIFVDADKKRVLVAPKIDDMKASFDYKKAAILRYVAIPKEFDVKDCAYAPAEVAAKTIVLKFPER